MAKHKDLQCTIVKTQQTNMIGDVYGGLTITKYDVMSILYFIFAL